MPARKQRNQFPPSGTKLTASFQGRTYEAVVTTVDDSRGRVAVRVGRDEYPTLSAAAKAITGAETNGWVFWRLERHSRAKNPT